MCIRDRIDRRLSVLDHRPILDVLRYGVSALLLLGADLIQCPLAQQRVGADPERRVAPGESLMDDVLDVGRRAGNPLQCPGRVRDRGIWAVSYTHLRAHETV